MKTVYIICLVLLAVIITVAIFIVVINRFEEIMSSNKKKPNNTGKYYFYNEFDRLINDKEHVIRNLIIPYENERYEIEGVIISRKGIFSIVSRTWEENITGGIDDEVWTVKGENKKNPLKVNELNKTYLSNLLNNEYEIRAITLIKSLSSINFMHESLYDLDSFVNEYALHSPMILSSEDIEKVYNELIKYKVTTDEIIALRKEKGEHVL